MGMAASQARHLALVARRSNCEYEGQQINQARTALANQSANLFNQMLGLSVPVPPSTQDYTKTQYSFTDGINASTIDSWQQLATKDENYNYVVTHHSYQDVYTGSQKLMNDPQVQFAKSPDLITNNYSGQVAAIQDALTMQAIAKEAYETAKAEYESILSDASYIANYKDSVTRTRIINSEKVDDNTYNVYQAKTTEIDGKNYPLYTGSDDVEYYFDGVDYISTADGTTKIPNGETVTPQSDTYTYVSYANMAEGDLKTKIANAITTWNTNGCEINPEEVFYDETNNAIALKKELDALVGAGTAGTATILPQYYIDDTTIPAGVETKSINGMQTEIDNRKARMETAKSTMDLAGATIESLNLPEYIGNCELNALSELTPDQKAEIEQIMKDMAELDVKTNFDKYYNLETGNYTGGIYQFKLNGIVYYTTYDDLANSALSGEGINHIDNQDKLAYYNATYVSTKIEETEKALLETDAQGRFVSVRLENDTVTYKLNMETITDDAAYEDAMNQYYYENAKYDKMVQDINAQTSIIQQQDQQLELRLKQLDTEHNALSTEIDAVSKVVKDNVDKSFKTFGG
ncbi:hypothetical protein IJD34_06070 [bacterium]|nr:hypothetical protein [bacterium]